MKWSKYNYFFTFDDKFLLYNSLSNSFAELDKDVFADLVNQKNKELIDLDEDLLTSLKKMKAIIDNVKDEFNAIKFEAHRKRFDKSNLSLTINPTLHCNFACIYCFEEDRQPIYMSEKVEDQIINFIQEKKPNSLNLDWFGGEPLMAFDRVVSLTRKIQKLNIKFVAGMITNGFLLTEEIIRQLPSLNINFLQITVDGLAQKHNGRRALVSGKGTFDRIVSNIDLLKTLEPNIQLTIRINIDHDNKGDFLEIYNFFNNKNYPKTHISCAFVHDIRDSKNLCLLNGKQQVEFLLEMKRVYDLDLINFYPKNNRYECAVRNVNTFVIGPEGEIYKCYNDVGKKDRIVGNLENIETNKKLLLRYLIGADPLEDEKCKTCFHLPTCGGGCPYLRLANEYEGKDFDVCQYIKGNLKEFLELYYLNKLKSEI